MINIFGANSNSKTHLPARINPSIASTRSTHKSHSEDAFVDGINTSPIIKMKMLPCILKVKKELLFIFHDIVGQCSL